MPAADPRERLLTACASLLCAAAAFCPLPAPAKAPFALALVLWLPGSALMAAAFPGRPRTLEFRALSVALSMALCIGCGLALNLAGHLDAAGWALGLSGLTLVACAIPRHASGPRLGQDSSGARMRLPDIAMLVLATLLGAGAVAHAANGAQAQAEYRFTEFWLVPSGRTGPLPAVLGIRNAEREAVRYEVDFLDGGKLVGRWPPMDLDAGETRTMSVTAKPGPEPRRLEARLYKAGLRDVVYRKVWMQVPVGGLPAKEE